MRTPDVVAASDLWPSSRSAMMMAFIQDNNLKRCERAKPWVVGAKNDFAAVYPFWCGVLRFSRMAFAH